MVNRKVLEMEYESTKEDFDGHWSRNLKHN